MNVKLTEIVSDITGKTGLGIIRALLASERDAQTSASWRDEHCKQDQATIAKAKDVIPVAVYVFRGTRRPLI